MGLYYIVCRVESVEDLLRLTVALAEGSSKIHVDPCIPDDDRCRQKKVGHRSEPTH